MDDDSWEARMSARAKARQAAADVAEREAEDRRLRHERVEITHSWMNGWPRWWRYTMLIGSGVHCIGCGKFFGTTTVVLDESWQPPEKTPDWPFSEADCPVKGCAEVGSLPGLNTTAEEATDS